MELIHIHIILILLVRLILYVLHLSGTLTFDVEMQSQGIVNRKNYNNTACTVQECSCIVNSISFYDGNFSPFFNCDNCNYNAWDHNCATIKTNIFSPVSSAITIKYDFDDAGFIYIDENICVDNLTTSTNSGSCSFQLTQIKYYSFSGKWKNSFSDFHYIVNWDYTGIDTDIPSAYLFSPSSLPGSPFTVEVVESICGDRIRTGLETCDDRNIISDDGCNSTCQVEVGWTCSGGSPTFYDTCDEICGDGIRFNSNATYCDDGDTNNGDGCNNTCQIEYEWICTGGSTTTQDICSEICGDGIRLNLISTYCDDGDNDSGDGCSITCQVEHGWICTGGSIITSDVCSEICGDGIRFNNNAIYCDDNNTSNGDGCSSTCQIELGWYCTGGSITTPDVCNEICGDGIRFNSNITYCDDKNTMSGDGCNSTCQVEHGWKCTGGNSTMYDTCTEVCGDGIRFNYLNVYCDDGNITNGDGCSDICAIERGWSCSGGSPNSSDICNEICSDGIRFSTNLTYCDDGNLVNGDGCNSTCAIEYDYECSGGTSHSQDICKEICGDGIRVNTIPTYCDDYNLINGDGCSSVCAVEHGYTCTGGGLHNKDICYLSYNLTLAEGLAVTATQAAAGVSFGANVGTSLITMSSPIGIFSLINQFQLLLLLLATGVFVSIGVDNMIKGLKITLLNFSFINLEFLPIFTKIDNYLLIVQPNENLSNIGIVYGSTFINLIQMILTIFSIMLIHMLFLPIYIRCNRLPIEHKCRILGFRIIELLTYTIYVRLMIQSTTTILLSAFSEFYQFKHSTQAEIVSFCINIFILLIYYHFFILCAWQVHRAYPKIRFGSLMYFTEFFRGIKNKPQCLVYPVIFLTVRVLSCLLVIVFAWINNTLKMAILSVINSAAALYLLIAKPFEKVNNSIYESMSQVVMAVFCIICIYYNTEDRWNSVINWVCISIIVITSLINAIMSIIELVKAIKSKIQMYLRKLKDNENKVTKITTKGNKREEHEKEENKNENNKQNGIFQPYSIIQLKNNKELFVQEAEFTFENEEQKVPQLPYQSPSTVSESSSNFMSSKRNESMPIRSRLNGRRKFLRDIDLP